MSRLGDLEARCAAKQRLRVDGIGSYTTTGADPIYADEVEGLAQAFRVVSEALRGMVDANHLVSTVAPGALVANRHLMAGAAAADALALVADWLGDPGD